MAEEEETLDLSLVDEEEEEGGMELSLAGEEEEASAAAPASGGWGITLKNPTIKVEKLVIKREE